MSYSRWSNSRWYTYWDTASGDTLDEQRFTVCGDGSFTYKELKENIMACVDKCKPETIPERHELRDYMRQFMQDAEARDARKSVQSQDNEET